MFQGLTLHSIAITTGLLVLALGCAKSEQLAPLETVYSSSIPETSVKVNFCTEPAYEQKQYLKTVVILDHSGSNKQNYRMNADGSGAPAIVNGTLDLSAAYATDPTGITRYGSVARTGTLLNYLSTLAPNDPADPTRYFALVNFSDQAETYPVNSQGFTSNVTDFYNHVLTDSGQAAVGGSPNDAGSTSYLSALKAAYTIITRDIQAAKACAAQPTTNAPSANCPKPGLQTASSYVVVFMSDGSPIIDVSGVGVDPSGRVVVTGDLKITKEPLDEILGQTAALSGLTADAKYVTSVNVFTIYYYSPGNVDLSSQDLLAKMARVGNGVSYNALGGSSIDYSRFQPPKKRIKFNLQDVFVTNSSLAWDAQGMPQLDSDADGLSDVQEQAFGTNPNRVSTDNNQISDLVKFRMENTAYNVGALCAAVPRVSGIYKSSDPAGLNDCEKMVLNDAGGINNPDSNSDMIPDWLELKNGVPFQIGTTPAVNIADQDGYSIYDKIKANLPLHVPLHQLTNARPARYELALTLSNDTQDCYALTVRDFPKVGDTDRVRVDIVMKSDLLRDTYLYRVGQKSFTSGSSSISFGDWNSAQEITNQTWKKWPQ